MSARTGGPISGKTGRRAEDTKPERRLLAALVLTAWRDARGGDLEAALWLAAEGAHMADEHLGFPVDAWRRADPAPIDRDRRHQRGKQTGGMSWGR